MKPTVLFILHMPPPVHGASMMGKYIHDSKVVNETFDCHYINLTTAKNLADIGRIGLRKLFQFIQLLNRIRKEVKRLKPQLVYVTPNSCGGAFYKDFIVIQLLKAMGCNVVAHYHNKGVATRQECIPDKWLYKHFFKGIKVILLAEPLYADIQQFVEREQVLFCPNGIPYSSTPETVRKNDVPHILFLSNLLIDKGVLILLDACKILKDRGYVFQCDFVGGETADMDAKRFKQECVQRGITDCVIYNGRKYGDEKLAFFKKADLFVLPTFNECFPLVLLEAMEQGLPCISSAIGGTTEIVDEGETGFLVPCREVEPLAERIGILLKDEALRKRLGEAGRIKFEKEYTLERFEENIKQCLETCLLKQ
ncbi:glycosyltransferase family 4 protein [uncultured Bacteroides sp.]|uniref:glycosyltransferase family 4 protein n=1 Tax=uncultured Bacteroides sp. TaxID=162156 RepID=UPI00259218E4|nr:glycosyltransferase family 4 protein [uncultured Bacteroides sp.]